MVDTISCENCGTENVSGVKFCKQCGNKLERSDQTAVAGQSSAPATAKERSGSFTSTAQRTTPVSHSTVRAENKYTALRGIARLCRTLSWIFVGLASLIALGGLVAMFDSFLAGVGTIIGAAVWGAVAYIFWQIVAESISVLLDIEANTRRTAALLEQWLK